MERGVTALALPVIGIPASSSYLTIEDAAAVLSITKKGVYAAIDRGHIEKVAALRGPVKTSDVLLYGIRQGHEPADLVQRLRQLRPDISAVDAFGELAVAVNLHGMMREVFDELVVSVEAN